MSIPIELLQEYGDSAIGIVVYGNAGLYKTNSIYTLPPPIMMSNWDKGPMSLLPWLRRVRHWDSKQWRDVSPEARTRAYERLNEQAKARVQANRIPPNPFIDMITYDNMNVDSYAQWEVDILSLDASEYNSVAVDSLQEHSSGLQTQFKGKGREMEDMQSKHWGEVQSKNIAALRYLRNLKDRGLFVYLTGSEFIDKDYVTDPRSAGKGNAPQEPFIIRGTINVTGKLVPAVQHCTDIMFRARTLNGQVVWVKDEEPVGAGGAMWQAKDRTGCLKQKYNPPNVRLVLDDIYGEEVRKLIYSHGLKQVAGGGA